MIQEIKECSHLLTEHTRLASKKKSKKLLKEAKGRRIKWGLSITTMALSIKQISQRLKWSWSKNNASSTWGITKTKTIVLMTRTITNRQTKEENNKITNSRDSDQILEERIYATLDKMIIRLLLRKQSKDQSQKMTMRSQTRNQLTNRDLIEDRYRGTNFIIIKILTMMMKRIVMMERMTKIAMKMMMMMMKNRNLRRKKLLLLNNIIDFPVTSI